MKKLILLSTISLLIFSCSKTIPVIEENSKKTMNEYSEILSAEDQFFFTETEITNNPSYKTNPIVIEEQKAKLKFRWGNGGCGQPIGFCLIFKFDNSDYGTSATVQLLEGNQMLIKSDTEDNGITSDGYFPIYEDFPVVDIFETGDVIIKEGIYEAFYNDELNRYESVIVDLL